MLAIRPRPRVAPFSTTVVGSQTPRISTTRPVANPFVGPIPAPTTDQNNIVACIEALKAGVESLAGQRGDATNRAVTFEDLIEFGLIELSTVQSPTGGDTLGSSIIAAAVTQAAAVNMPPSTPVDVLVITLPTGDWEVSGNIAIALPETSTAANYRGWINTVAATHPQLNESSLLPYSVIQGVSNPGENMFISLGPGRVSVQAPTAVYLGVQAAYKGGGGAVAWGWIKGRRS